MQKKAIRKRTGTFKLLAGFLVLFMIPVQLPWTEAQAKTLVDEPSGMQMNMISEMVTAVLDTGEQPSFSSVSSELRQYDWDCYSNDYYYLKLSANERLLYERLDATCGELLTTKKNATSYKLGNGVVRKGTEMISFDGLTYEQVYKVLYVFVYGNPQYYFINNILLFSSKQQCSMGIYDIFADGSSREQSTLQVKTLIEQYESTITPSTMYSTDKQIHDLLCSKLYYMTDAEVLTGGEDTYYTQSIYGALTLGGTVCAGYTKLYALLCSYFGLDCVCVLSEHHAWNEVRYGDQWYVVDVTWDDTGGGESYFHLSDQQTTARDQSNYHVPESFYSSLRPVAKESFSNSLKNMRGLDQPNVTVTDTAEGVTITLNSSQGDIYYTLDGSIPSSSNKYTKPVTLTKSGAYVLTAVTSANGKLSSAYDICPIRIAGGSISIASAVNNSEKTISVTVQSSTNYLGYEVSYATKKNFKNERIINTSEKSTQISDLKKGTTYYVRVRGYQRDAYGNYYYTPCSKIKKVKIKK